MFRVRVFLIALVFALAGQSAAALTMPVKSVDVIVVAPTASGTPMVLKTVVLYGDLDPTTAAGASALLDRIRTAATRACTKRKDRESPRVPAEHYAACVQRGVADAVRLLDVPEIARAFDVRGQ
jgi:UrcA family protein